VQIAQAKAICRACPVIDRCGAWVEDNPELAEFGIWAGKTEDERRAARRGWIKRCAECRGPMQVTSGKQKYCGPGCYRASRTRAEQNRRRSNSARVEAS
jgi:hypothetical protein